MRIIRRSKRARRVAQKSRRWRRRIKTVQVRMEGPPPLLENPRRRKVGRTERREIVKKMVNNNNCQMAMKK